MVFSKLISHWWNRNGWTIVIVFSFLILFILWLCNAGKLEASSDTDIQNAMNVMLGPNLTSNFENTKTVMNEKKRTNDSFIYEEGASKGENLCRKIMQELTGMKFYKVRPDFMRNPVTGVFLELDCYNDTLKLAVEYNGAQHDKYNKFMHQGSMDKFRNQQYRDYIKRTLCQENNVYLIVVPHTVKLKELRPFLVEKLKPYLENRMEIHRNDIFR